MLHILKTIGKRLPLFAAILGAGLAMAFSPSTKNTKTVIQSTDSQYWYIYDGSGTKTSPSSYVYSGTDPGCEGFSRLCSIKAEGTTGTNGHPSSSSLNTLSSQSNGFTQNYSGSNGVVALED